MAAPAPKPHVYTAQISEDELPVHPWCFDEGVQNYPGRNLPRIVTDVVNAFRGNPEVSVLPHPDRLDLLYLRITPAHGPAQGRPCRKGPSAGYQPYRSEGPFCQQLAAVDGRFPGLCAPS